MKPLFAMLVAVVLSATAVADEPQFLIEMELWLHGELRDKPTLIVAAETPSSMEVGDWRIELKVERPGAEEGAPGGAIWLHVSIFERDGEGWDLLADTILGVPEGQASSMIVVDADIEAVPENSIVYFSARASRLRASD